MWDFLKKGLGVGMGLVQPLTKLPYIQTPLCTPKSLMSLSDSLAYNQPGWQVIILWEGLGQELPSPCYWFRRISPLIPTNSKWGRHYLQVIPDVIMTQRRYLSKVTHQIRSRARIKTQLSESKTHALSYSTPLGNTTYLGWHSVQKVSSLK